MLKSEVEQRLAEKMTEITGQDINKKVSKEVLDAFFDILIDGVKSDGEVRFPGFGSFKKKFRPEREGTKPGTSEKMTYAASTTVTFKAGKELKTRVHDSNA
jgi:nucleoid DNA-binding protein